MNNKILYALIATTFVVGLFTSAYAGITLPMINLAGDVDILGQMTCSECVNTADIAENAVVATKIADGAVVGGTGGDIADNTITAEDIAANAVGGSEIAGTTKLIFGTCSVSVPQQNPGDTTNRLCTEPGAVTGDKVIVTINNALPCRVVTDVTVIGTTLNLDITSVINSVCIADTFDLQYIIFKN